MLLFLLKLRLKLLQCFLDLLLLKNNRANVRKDVQLFKQLAICCEGSMGIELRFMLPLFDGDFTF